MIWAVLGDVRVFKKTSGVLFQIECFQKAGAIQYLSY